MPDLSDYPGWLPELLIDGWSQAEWDAAQTITFPDFLDRFSLHDSFWYGIWIKPNSHFMMVIRWDNVIADVAFAGQETRIDWPILMIEFRVPPYQLMI